MELDCGALDAKIFTAAFQGMSRTDVDAAARHMEGCSRCNGAFRTAVNVRLATDAIEARARTSRPFRGSLWLRLLTPTLVAILLAFGARASLRAAQSAYERRFLSRLERGVFAYRLATGAFPSASEPLARSLAAVPSRIFDVSRERVDGDGHFLDRWGGRYRYLAPGRHHVDQFDVWGPGRNGREEEGKGDDVSNWSDDQFVPLPAGVLVP